MKIFKVRPDAKLPTKASNDMCYDIHACIDQPIYVNWGEVTKIPTGIIIDFGEYHASIRARSGMASKGIGVLGGQIDSGFRGEIIVMLTMHNNTFRAGESYKIENGDKIAQMKLEQDITVDVIEVNNFDELSVTDRAGKGFGSSGR